MAAVDEKEMLKTIEHVQECIEKDKQDYARYQGQKDQIWSSLKGENISSKEQLMKKIADIKTQREKLLKNLQDRFTKAAEKYGWV